MEGILRFQILGPLRACRGDEELDLGPGKQRAVLTVLLLNVGRPVSVAQIVEAVWSDDPPENGANVVQKYVVGLRRVLDPDRPPRSPAQLLALTDAGYVLRVAPDAVDAEVFQQKVRRARAAQAEHRLADTAAELRAALALWHGEPLAGLSGSVFEVARARLVDSRATAQEAWAETGLRLGLHREVAADLVKMVGEFPYREQLRGQLMLALYRCGRQAEALATFRDVRGLLRDEYGIEPGASLQELHRRILRSDPTLAAPAAPAEDPEPAPAAVAAAAPGEDEATVEPDPQAPGGPTMADPPAPGGPVVAAPGGPVVAAPGGPVVAAPGGPAVADPAALGGPTMADPPAPNHPAPATAVTYPPDRVARRTWVTWVETALSVALVLVSFGVLTWAVMLYYAGRRRSRWLGLAALGYLSLLGLFVTAMELTGENENALSALDAAGLLALLVAWLGGAAHVVLLNERLGLFQRPRYLSDANRRIRREQARYLVYQHPTAWRDLLIGRPDLPRTFDDGGLIDVNAVPESVLAGLPGLTPQQARLIAVDRWMRGPFASMEELAARCLLPLAAADTLREILLFVPPPSASDATQPAPEEPVQPSSS
jgi:DNA-binding SARP family transcriptional activator